MTTAIARQAIRAWPRHELATRQQIKTLRRGFIRQLQHLGDRYLFAREQFVVRKPAP